MPAFLLQKLCNGAWAPPAAVYGPISVQAQQGTWADDAGRQLHGRPLLDWDSSNRGRSSS